MKIKGFGGIFLRSKDISGLKKWYEDVLGISMGDWNMAIMKPEEGNETVFSLFDEESSYFPVEQSVMLNFQVEDIDGWMGHFDKLGIELLKGPEKSEYGTFIWISDPEGQWIEIWEK